MAVTDDRATRDTDPAPPTPLGDLIGKLLRDALKAQTRAHEGGADGFPPAPERSGADLHAPGPSLVRLGALPAVLDVLGIECKRRVRSIRGLGPAWQGEGHGLLIQVSRANPNPKLDGRLWLISVLRDQVLMLTVRGVTFEQARDGLRGRLGMAVAS